MRLQKLGHACIRLDKDLGGSAGTLVIDPGGLTEENAFAGAHAVLITHEHFDHLDQKRLDRALTDNPQLEVWTNKAVAAQVGSRGGRVHAVGAGDTFSAAGFSVQVYGEHHAAVHPDIPRVGNIGFLVDAEVFHPGDAFTVPGVPVGTLLAPTAGPWLKTAEMMDYVREIGPRRAYSIHDGLLNEVGLGLVDGHLKLVGEWTGADCRRLLPGESVQTG
jgi:L-ascorbate metabolism protein UlaG (beta-lactamase superfamily)